MKATVRFCQTVQISADDRVIDELMSAKWQNSFYTFATRDEAIVWLADMINRFGSTERVDGLVGIGNVASVDVQEFDGEVLEVTA